MDDGDWNSGFARSLMVFLNGDAIPELDSDGPPHQSTITSCCCSTPTCEPISFTLPPKAFGSDWAVRLDTDTGAVDPADVKPWRARTKHSIQAHSMVVLSTSVVPEEERRASRTRAAKVTPTIARTSQQQ